MREEVRRRGGADGDQAGDGVGEHRRRRGGAPPRSGEGGGVRGKSGGGEWLSVAVVWGCGGHIGQGHIWASGPAGWWPGGPWPIGGEGGFYSVLLFCFYFTVFYLILSSHYLSLDKLQN